MVEVYIGMLRGEYLAQTRHNTYCYNGFFKNIPSWVPNELREGLMLGWTVTVMFTEQEVEDRLERVKRGIL